MTLWRKHRGEIASGLLTLAVLLSIFVQFSPAYSASFQNFPSRITKGSLLNLTAIIQANGGYYGGELAANVTIVFLNSSNETHYMVFYKYQDVQQLPNPGGNATIIGNDNGSNNSTSYSGWTKWNNSPTSDYGYGTGSHGQIRFNKTLDLESLGFNYDNYSVIIYINDYEYPIATRSLEYEPYATISSQYVHPNTTVTTSVNIWSNNPFAPLTPIDTVNITITCPNSTTYTYTSSGQTQVVDFSKTNETGDYTVTARVNDTAGNSDTTTLYFHVYTPANFSFSDPHIPVGNSETITLTIDGEFDMTTADIIVTRGGLSVTSTTTGSSGTFQVQSAQTAESGKYITKVVARNAAGYTETLTKTFTVFGSRIETGAPKTYSGGTMRIRGVAEYLNFTHMDINISGPGSMQNNDLTTNPYVVLFTNTASAGTYTITLGVYGEYEGSPEGRTITKTFSVDNTPATVTGVQFNGSSHNKWRRYQKLNISVGVSGTGGDLEKLNVSVYKGTSRLYNNLSNVSGSSDSVWFNFTNTNDVGNDYRVFAKVYDGAQWSNYTRNFSIYDFTVTFNDNRSTTNDGKVNVSDRVSIITTVSGEFNLSGGGAAAIQHSIYCPSGSDTIQNDSSPWTLVINSTHPVGSPVHTTSAGTCSLTTTISNSSKTDTITKYFYIDSGARPQIGSISGPTLINSTSTHTYTVSVTDETVTRVTVNDIFSMPVYCTPDGNITTSPFEVVCKNVARNVDNHRTLDLRVSDALSQVNYSTLDIDIYDFSATIQDADRVVPSGGPLLITVHTTNESGQSSPSLNMYIEVDDGTPVGVLNDSYKYNKDWTANLTGSQISNSADTYTASITIRLRDGTTPYDTIYKNVTIFNRPYSHSFNLTGNSDYVDTSSDTSIKVDINLEASSGEIRNNTTAFVWKPGESTSNWALAETVTMTIESGNNVSGKWHGEYTNTSIPGEYTIRVLATDDTGTRMFEKKIDGLDIISLSDLSLNPNEAIRPGTNVDITGTAQYSNGTPYDGYLNVSIDGDNQTLYVSNGNLLLKLLPEEGPHLVKVWLNESTERTLRGNDLEAKKGFGASWLDWDRWSPDDGANDGDPVDFDYSIENLNTALYTWDHMVVTAYIGSSHEDHDIYNLAPGESTEDSDRVDDYWTYSRDIDCGDDFRGLLETSYMGETIALLDRIEDGDVQGCGGSGDGGGGSSGGGGGGKTIIKEVTGEMAVTEFNATPGDTVEAVFNVTVWGFTVLDTITVNVTGLDQSWYSPISETQTMTVNETRTFTLTINVPGDTAAGDYPFTINTSDATWYLAFRDKVTVTFDCVVSVTGGAAPQQNQTENETVNETQNQTTNVTGEEMPSVLNASAGETLIEINLNESLQNATVTIIIRDSEGNIIDTITIQGFSGSKISQELGELDFGNYEAEYRIQQNTQSLSGKIPLKIEEKQTEPQKQIDLASLFSFQADMSQMANLVPIPLVIVALLAFQTMINPRVMNVNSLKNDIKEMGVLTEEVEVLMEKIETTKKSLKELMEQKQRGRIADNTFKKARDLDKSKLTKAYDRLVKDVSLLRKHSEKIINQVDLVLQEQETKGVDAFKQVSSKK